MALTSAYEGASQGLRLQKKGLLYGDPDTYAARELQMLWARSHHLCRNNPAAITAKNRLVAHWVGTGIKVRWENKRLQKAWEEFILNPCIDNHGSIYNLQALWAGALFESGESLTQMKIKRGTGVIPLKLQAIEAEQLDPRYSALKIRNSIQFAGSVPTHYHFLQHHPALGILQQVNKRIAIPADRVLHIFNRERPGQWRGIPKLAPAMLTIYELDELTDATLVRQKAAQAVGWIITKKGTGSLPLLGSLETTDQLSPEGKAEVEGSRLQRILSGGVHYLAEDEDVSLGDIADIGANFTALLEHNWRAIASCLDVTYEQLTGNLTEVNYSSIRAGVLEFRKRVALVQQQMLISLGMRPLTDFFRELASVYISKAMNKVPCSFIFPKLEWIDPLKDTTSDVQEVQAGFATLQAKLEERGIMNIEEHIQKLAEEQGYNIILSTNPSKEYKEKQNETVPETT